MVIFGRSIKRYASYINTNLSSYLGLYILHINTNLSSYLGQYILVIL